MALQILIERQSHRGLETAALYRCLCHAKLSTHRRQVSHHEEGCEGGVKEEGDPLCGCSWDAQAAYAAGVCCRNIVVLECGRILRNSINATLSEDR